MKYVYADARRCIMGPRRTLRHELNCQLHSVRKQQYNNLQVSLRSCNMEELSLEFAAKYKKFKKNSVECSTSILLADCTVC